MFNLTVRYRQRVLGITVIGFFAFGPMTSRVFAQPIAPVTATGPVGAPAGPVVMVTGNRAVTLSDRLVWPHLRSQVRAIGNRLVVKGSERTTLVGHITRGSLNSPIKIVSEISGNLRYEEQSGGATRVLSTDTKTVSGGTAPLALNDTDLLESLANDSVEHFLLGQMTSAPTRFHGANYRIDNGRNPNYTGPYYDLYEAADQVFEPTARVKRNKLYCLNTQTLLLERVRYKLRRGANPVQVEVLLSNWKQFQGHQFPTTIARTENGQAVFTVSISSATVGPTVADGIFSVRP
jgi:hypothetical protein